MQVALLLLLQDHQFPVTHTLFINGAAAPLADVSDNILTTTTISQQSTVTVIVTNASGCSDTASLTVYVPKAATAGVIAANAADLVLCPGDNIAFDMHRQIGTLMLFSAVLFSPPVATANATTGNDGLYALATSYH
ncbi:MAG: hypothetical protein CM15mP122_4060 [Bacteroidota bacterium]|nr:MAG: hypothetical protein CM15mP122_4060 [Bacteroidota bacterium]